MSKRSKKFSLSFLSLAVCLSLVSSMFHIPRSSVHNPYIPHSIIAMKLVCLSIKKTNRIESYWIVSFKLKQFFIGFRSILNIFVVVQCAARDCAYVHMYVCVYVCVITKYPSTQQYVCMYVLTRLYASGASRSAPSVTHSLTYLSISI